LASRVFYMDPGAAKNCKSSVSAYIYQRPNVANFPLYLYYVS